MVSLLPGVGGVRAVNSGWGKGCEKKETPERQEAAGGTLRGSISTSQMTSTMQVGRTGCGEGQGRGYSINITTKTAIPMLLAWVRGENFHITNAFRDRFIYYLNHID